MKFKNFDQYIEQYSTDINSFINKVAIATSESINFPYFDYIKSSFDINEKFSNIPIIISSDFTFESDTINESSRFKYNLNEAPKIDKVYADFINESFVPKSVTDIKQIKQLKFPITAYNKHKQVDYLTKGKLKSAEEIYERFREKIVPKTKFNVLSFKGKPISIVEKINKFPLDVDLNKFKYINEVSKISSALNEKYNLDFYNIEILESAKGGLYLSDVNKQLTLNPHQAFKVYESSYEDYYQARIPNWVKNKMIEECVGNYYKQKSYDSMLFNSKHTMDYSKYR